MNVHLKNSLQKPPNQLLKIQFPSTINLWRNSLALIFEFLPIEKANPAWTASTGTIFKKLNWYPLANYRHCHRYLKFFRSQPEGLIAVGEAHGGKHHFSASRNVNTDSA